MFVVAHISDLHFDGTRRHRQRITSVLRYIDDRADGIDALMITGDITNDAHPGQFREAAETVASVVSTSLPTLVTIGNHDDRSGFAQAFGGYEPDAEINSSLLVDGVLLISADSSVPGRSDGYLTDGTLAWISAEIAAAGPQTPVLVGFHHPPVDLQMPFMDSIRQTGEERLAALVDQHPNITGFLCGHAHSGAVTAFAGRQLCVAPGVASTLNLPFEGSDIVNPGQPPGIAFHVLDGWRLTTHFRSVP